MLGLDNLSDLSEAIASVPLTESTTSREFIQKHWISSLNGNTHSDRFTLGADTKLVMDCQAYLKEWKLPKHYLKNMTIRLEGMRYLPPLVLQNPSEEERLPYDMMAARAPTFLWFNDTLNPLHLDLRDIPTINLFPFITESWLNSLSKADQERALRGSLDLTVQFFETYQPETVISCQCLRQGAPEWLGPVIDHPLVIALSSTVSGAKNRKVRRATFAGHTINVIQGFHPSYIFRAPNAGYENDRQRILSSLLIEIYTPCQEWRKQNIITDLTNTLCEVQKSASAMRDLISRFQTSERQLHNVSKNTRVRTYYSDKSANDKTKVEFSIRTWNIILGFFLSKLPSQTMTLKLSSHEEPKLTNLFPTEVRITSKNKQFVIDLLKDAVHMED